MKTVNIKGWQDFRDWVRADRWGCPTYWRGQADPSWPLASGFEREMLRLNGGWEKDAEMLYPYGGRLKSVDPHFYQRYRDAQLSMFQAAMAGLRGPNPPQLDKEELWWALGRHYGLVTPLVDWTEKPYIAAFFALAGLLEKMHQYETIDRDGRRHPPGGGLGFHGLESAVYRLAHNETLEGDGLRVVPVVLDELARMHRQRGLFTWLNSVEYFELQGFLDNTGRGDLLTCLRLSDQCVLEGLRDLDQHGIDYRSIYPDIEGAVRYANWKLAVGSYLLGG